MLRVVEAKTATLDDICENLEMMKLAKMNTADKVDNINLDLKDIKENANNPKALTRIEQGLDRKKK